MKTRALIVSLLALVVTMAFASSAEPKALASNTDAAESKAELKTQGPEGSWLYTVTIPGFTFQGIETYAAGGGYTEADQLSFNPVAVASAGHGAWKMTDGKTFGLTYINLTFDGFSSGNPTGTLKVRQTTTISKSGNAYTGSGDYTYYDLNDDPIPSISGTFTITAQRIVVQAPQ